MGFMIELWDCEYHLRLGYQRREGILYFSRVFNEVATLTLSRLLKPLPSSDAPGGPFPAFLWAVMVQGYACQLLLDLPGLEKLAFQVQ
jgi:hypothetical protein